MGYLNCLRLLQQKFLLVHMDHEGLEHFVATVAKRQHRAAVAAQMRLETGRAPLVDAHPSLQVSRPI